MKVQALHRVTLPALDLDAHTDRQVVVDREPGQYLAIGLRMNSPTS